MGEEVQQRDLYSQNSVSKNIADEMKSSFIDYAMSIIVSRALPDVRDGLKPVHRRILYAMNEIGLPPDKAHKKCARIVGEVLGKYHPHGDSAVYEALVRLAQPFSSRYTLVDGHGNFGSLDDNAAAMRYTEARLSKVSTEILADIESETVDFTDNFDGSLKEPVVMPSKLPMLLLNGTTGIAVGMATNIPPHNLKEITNALIYQIDNPDCQISDLLRFVKGPDFPSGGIIMGTKGIRDAFETGRGTIPVRGKAEIEEIGTKGSKTNAIVIKELPYLVGPEAFIEKIADLVKNEKIFGIADLNDESDRHGMRVVIKLKRDANPDVVLNNLYKLTPLQQSFSVNALALVNGRPKLLNLKEILSNFIEHRVEVLTRRAKFNLRKAQEREHIVSGLLKAQGSLDEVVKLVRASASAAEAKQSLISKFDLTEIQADAILEMQLRRLTGLEREKLQKEQAELLQRISQLQELIASRQLILEDIKKELSELGQKYGDERKTQVSFGEGDLSIEDLIPNDSMMVFLTSQGYIKRVPSKIFESQNRAGRGKGGIAFREEDDLQTCFSANMHDSLLFFTTRGVVYTAKVHEVPEGQRQNKGKALVNIVPLLPEETCTAVIPLKAPFSENENLIMLTRKGLIKKVLLSSFANVRRSGIIALGLNEDDELGWVRSASGTSDIVIATHDGMTIRYSSDELRAMGRTAAGVKAITLRDGDRIVCCETFEKSEEENTYALFVTDDGYGKRVPMSEFRNQKRGGIGLIGIKFKRLESKLSSIIVLTDSHEVIIASANGVVLRQRASEIPSQSRMATGVRLQQLPSDDRVISVIAHKEEIQEDETGENTGIEGAQEEQDGGEETLKFNEIIEEEMEFAAE